MAFEVRQSRGAIVDYFTIGVATSKALADEIANRLTTTTPGFKFTVVDNSPQPPNPSPPEPTPE